MTWRNSHSGRGGAAVMYELSAAYVLCCRATYCPAVSSQTHTMWSIDSTGGNLVLVRAIRSLRPLLSGQLLLHLAHSSQSVQRERGLCVGLF